MKKTILKVSAAALLLSQVLLVGGVEGKAVDAALPRVATTVTAKPAVPVMTDNLFKYGLKKAMNLPVTLSSEGLSFTLHKIMIYDIQSTEVKKLKNLYGFQNGTSIIQDPKYMIWTKVTIQNNTTKTIHGSGNDIWILLPFYFQDGKNVSPVWPRKLAEKTNSSEALWTYTLKPGQKITSYLAYYYKDSFDYFSISLMYGKNYVEKYVVPK
ncbi:hypothetical protein G5B47_09410 [Paenibacillus sp. 7124]|uniref:Uncharacterized protein n=1 Tax=Paenibacillus apii TaxID=1850370 RepID=A0A6M1PJW1_9BACL|nr:hypothetical protein [Paenibacillus apii]NGM82635.1 hypothetical protein [Paenibacillus apii]